MRSSLAILLLSGAIAGGTVSAGGAVSADRACPAGPAFLHAPGDTTGSLRLSLNVPAYRLDVVVDGEIERSWPVAVGTPDHRTPIGSFSIDHVVWNPWWVPPPFEWAADASVTPPGPTNPVGRVKLFFGFYHFVHGTPMEESLGTAGSHGCVRMRNADAVELARIVHRHASPGVTEATLDSLEADPGRTRTIRLAEAVPMSIRYDRIEVRDGRLEIHPDVYGLVEIAPEDVRKALRAAGIAAGKADDDLLRWWIDRAARQEVSIPLGPLL
ncbi:MAG: L,D-transpeptidase [Gemmatimonadota bacterium]|nr:L,D-transpeptidase [Gemmatimonadota bacterium]